MEATDRVFEQGAPGDQREQLLGPFGRAQRPEARADAAGEHHRPHREGGDLIVDRRELRPREGARGASSGERVRFVE